MVTELLWIIYIFWTDLKGITKSSKYVKAACKVAFLSTLLTWVWHSLLVWITSSSCSLAFLVRDTFFFPSPNTREYPTGESRVSSVGWRAAISLPGGSKTDSGIGETLSCVVGMICSRGHSLSSMKAECKQCNSPHWVLANEPSQSTVKESRVEMIVLWRTVSAWVTGYTCNDPHSRYSRYQPVL